MEVVKITSFLQSKLEDLTTILFEKEYFGFLQSSEEYVNKIFHFINTIPIQLKHYCINVKYGKYYAIFKMNNNTTYYITYDFENAFYLIKKYF